ncbi:MAG: hypothetical protein FWD49_02340 [Firmicutes bacterium]|nr:hypothetical protein [Bacillota bacterium]
MVLNKKEKVLMDVVYDATSEKTGRCIVSPFYILSKIPYKHRFNEEDLQPVLEALSIDGYFEYEHAEKKGEMLFLISLKEKGLGYAREKKDNRKKLIRRIVTTIIFAVLGYSVRWLIGVILGI